MFHPFVYVVTISSLLCCMHECLLKAHFIHEKVDTVYLKTYQTN